MPPVPYFGVTGFTSPDEVDNVCDSYMTSAYGSPLHGGRRLMVGVLVSHDTLNGRPAEKWPERYPDTARVAEIFSAAVKKTRHGSADLEVWPNGRGLGPEWDLKKRTLRFIHYHTREPQLPAQLDRLLEIAGDHLSGIQLNVTWPSIGELYAWKKVHLHRKLRLVIQVNRAMFDDCDRDPVKLCRSLGGYSGIMSDVFFDMSGGQGEPFDLAQTSRVIEFLFYGDRNNPGYGGKCNIGVAGGIDHTNVADMKLLLERFPNLSTDAEARIRDVFPVKREDGTVDKITRLGELARYYLRNAYGIL